MRQIAGVVLTLVVSIVASISVPAFAAKPAAYAPWVDEQQRLAFAADTGESAPPPTTTTPNYGCSLETVAQISMNVARTALVDANGDRAQAVALYKERNRPAIAEWLKNQTTVCQTRLLHQSNVTVWLATHRPDLAVKYVNYLVTAADDWGTGCGCDLPAEAQQARDTYAAQSGQDAWGVSLAAGPVGMGYAVLGAALAVGGLLATNPVTQQTLNALATLAGSIGVGITALGNFVDWVSNTIAAGREHSSGAGSNHDPNGDK